MAAAMKAPARKIPCELVIAGGDTAEVLETSKHALDEFVLAVEPFALGDRLAAAGGGRNDGFGTLLVEKHSQAIGIVGFVGDQPLDRPGRSKESRCQRNIVDAA